MCPTENVYILIISACDLLGYFWGYITDSRPVNLGQLVHLGMKAVSLFGKQLNFRSVVRVMARSGEE